MKLSKVISNEIPSHCVKSTKHYYGDQKNRHSIVFSGSRAECLEFIKKSNDKVYRLDHNEIGRRRLRIINTNNLTNVQTMFFTGGSWVV